MLYGRPLGSTCLDRGGQLFRETAGLPRPSGRASSATTAVAAQRLEWSLSLVSTEEGVHGHGATVPIRPQSGRATAQGLPLPRQRGGRQALRQCVLLLPIDDPWQTLEDGLAAFEPGFVLERDQPDQQQREPIQP